MNNVYIVEREDAFTGEWEIDTVFADKDRATSYAADIIVSHWSPDDNELWEEEMEETGKYISKFDLAKKWALDMENWVRVSEWDVD